MLLWAIYNGITASNLRHNTLRRQKVTMEFQLMRDYVNRPHSHWQPAVYIALKKVLEGDPIIKRVLDRVVGTLCVCLFPGHKCGDFRVYVPNGYPNWVVVGYRIPSIALMHPVLIHLLFALGRECLVFAGWYEDHFIPVATDEEVERALNGDTALAKETFSLLMPNLRILSRPVQRQFRLLSYLLDNNITASEAFGRRPWATLWQPGNGPWYWDAAAHNALNRKIGGAWYA